MSSTNPGGSASRRCRRAYDDVMRQCDQLEKLAAQPDDRLTYRAEKVSAWSVADHLDHLARSNQAMVGAIETALDSDDAGGKPSFIGRAVLLTGWIPRGAGKAPEFTRPETGSREEVGRRLGEAREVLGLLEARLPEIDSARGRVNHFAFGDLTPRLWLSVIDIHTRHHLKIVDAIQRAPGSPWLHDAR